MTGRRLVGRHLLAGSVAGVVANTAGAVVVGILLLFVLPTPEEATPSIAGNLILAAVYIPVAMVVGIVGGIRLSRRRLEWLRADRQPSAEERWATIGLNMAITRVDVGLWLVATALFTAVNISESFLLAVEIALTVGIGGLVSAASSYLLIERINRPLLARAMAGAPLDQPRGTGVAWRTLVSWGLGTALPVAGLVLLNGLAIGLDIARRDLAIATFVLGLAALTGGLLIMVFLARSIADPLRQLRAAVTALAEGDRDVKVEVYDSTEVGVLQNGFNQMVAGLAERDRIHDLFGRHVGPEVARKALEDGVALGGEVRDVAVLFVDVVGSTTLAEHTAPTEVVARLNRFLGAVVSVVDAHGGTINAFQGDAALAVWGAPLPHTDPYTAALQAARSLGRRLAEQPGMLAAGIGVSSGRVVAGNIGAAERLQYTVIGDPVNEAARLTERAKQEAGRVLASAVTVRAATPEESRCWHAVAEEVLRGRSDPTQLCVPV